MSSLVCVRTTGDGDVFSDIVPSDLRVRMRLSNCEAIKRLVALCLSGHSELLYGIPSRSFLP